MSLESEKCIEGLKDLQEIQEWCIEKYANKPKYTRRLPKKIPQIHYSVKSKENETEEQKETRLAYLLGKIEINSGIFYKYKIWGKDELSDGEKWLIDKWEYLQLEYGLTESEANLLEAEEWCKEKFEGQPKYMRRLPRTAIVGVKPAIKGEIETEDQKEIRLGSALGLFKKSNVVYNKYKNFGKDALTLKEKNMIEKYEKLLQEYDHAKLNGIGKNLYEIELWCKEHFLNKPKYLRRLPRFLRKSNNENSDINRERKLGIFITKLKSESEIFKKYRECGKSGLNEAERELIDKWEYLVKEYDYAELNLFGTKILELEKWCKEKFDGKPKYLRRFPIGGPEDTNDKELNNERKVGNLLSLLKLNVLYKKYLNKGIDSLNDLERELIEKLIYLDNEYNLTGAERFLLETEEWCKEKYQNVPKELRKLPEQKCKLRKTLRREGETEVQREARLGTLKSIFKSNNTTYLKYKENGIDSLTPREKKLIEKWEYLVSEYDCAKVDKAKVKRDDAKDKNKEARKLELEVLNVYEKNEKTNEG